MKYCLTVEDIYGTPNPALPTGWELTGEFRPPKEGDMFLVAGEVKALGCRLLDYPMGVPRLILRKAPTVEGEYMGQTMGKLRENFTKSPDYGKFEWTGEFRPVQAGEYFLGAAGGSYVLGPEVRGAWLGQYRVIVKKLPTVEDIYGAPLEKLKAPSGYRFTGEFRRPTAEDICLHPTGVMWVRYDWVDPDQVENLNPRLILEKLPPSPTIEDVYGTAPLPIPKGWKMKEFRQIKAGENVYYLGIRYGVVWSERPHHAKNEFCRVAGYKDGFRIVLERDLSQMSYTKVMSVADVYGSIPKVPKGYRVVDFRVAEEGELILAHTGIAEPAWGLTTATPRLILERED